MAVSLDISPPPLTGKVPPGGIDYSLEDFDRIQRGQVPTPKSASSVPAAKTIETSESALKTNLKNILLGIVCILCALSIAFMFVHTGAFIIAAGALLGAAYVVTIGGMLLITYCFPEAKAPEDGALLPNNCVIEISIGS